MTKIRTWHGCYDGSMRDLITPESFSHPAKMSRLLTERIFDHGRERGYWQPVDMFTGESEARVVERKSFFRRLAEKKGSPRIDWEEVIWAVKP